MAIYWDTALSRLPTRDSITVALHSTPASLFLEHAAVPALRHGGVRLYSLRKEVEQKRASAAFPRRNGRAYEEGTAGYGCG